jgi:dihydrolipoamide dehydrogenase
VPGVYAAGDVREGPMTANAALYDGKLVVENALGGERTRANYFKVPFVVNSALEIATVGLTEAQAEGAGFAPRVAHASFGASGKARARHDYDGFIEVVHDLETGQLLGGCIVGPEAGEQILLLGAACRSERGLWFLKDMSYSHPSWCEELERAIDPYAASLAREAENLFRPGIHAGD